MTLSSFINGSDETIIEHSSNGFNGNTNNNSSVSKPIIDPDIDPNRFAFDAEACQFIKSKIPHEMELPSVGIICGSGLYKIGEILQDSISIPYQEIPGMFESKVEGHQNIVIIGQLDHKTIICFQGRCHYYEGIPLWKVTFPVRVMKLLGVSTLILTNSAGGVNPDFKTGDIMVINDHINMLGVSGKTPLRGPNHSGYGTRFPSMENCYDIQLRIKCRDIFGSLSLGHIYRHGVYACVSGPSYETISELRMLRMVGADSVGMSTAHETIVGRHCGLKICGLSLISNTIDLTNYKIEDYENGKCANGHEINHEEVLLSAKESVSNMANVIKHLIAAL